MKKANGFAITQVILVAAVLIAAGLLFWQQYSTTQGKDRDLDRKTAINAISYTLDNVYYTQNNYYPAALTSKTFTVIDPYLMKDPEGHMIGQPNSDYRYEPTGCVADHCLGYSLRAQLKYEAEYVKAGGNQESDK